MATVSRCSLPAGSSPVLDLKWPVVCMSQVSATVGFNLSQATKSLRESRGIDLLYFRPLHCKGWGVSVTPRSYLTPRERTCTHFTGCWVGLKAGLDWCGKSRPTGIRSPDRPARRQSLYQLSYPSGFCYCSIGYLTVDKKLLRQN